MSRPTSFRLLAAALAVAGLLGGRPARAEVIEEIVAWVEGTVITLSAFREEEQIRIQELYRQHVGADLDRELEDARSGLLLEMIDRKILLQRAKRVFDLERAGETYLRTVREEQGIATNEELERLLAQQGMTLEQFKQQLIENFAPREIIAMEVGRRISVGDREVEEYYDSHSEEFERPGSVLLREIVILANTPGADREERRAEAERVHRRLLEPGADFAEIAKEASDAGTAAEGGLLGPLEQGEVSEKLEEIAFSLPIGEVSEILEMPYGFHIVRVEEREEAARIPLDEVREELRSRFENEKYDDAVQAYLESAREDVDWQVNPKYKDRLPARYEAHIRR